MPGFRDASLRPCVSVGAVAALAAELLGAFHLPRLVPLAMTTAGRTLVSWASDQYAGHRIARL